MTPVNALESSIRLTNMPTKSNAIANALPTHRMPGLVTKNQGSRKAEIPSRVASTPVRVASASAMPAATKAAMATGGVMKDSNGNPLYMNNKEYIANMGNPPVNDAILAGGRSEIVGGGLEASTADVATEFANMILTQRGYQANTRMVTVTDSMLEELVNMKR